jgi:hypothetical protein
MVKKKKQKVRFHKGDKRPNNLEKKLKYKVEMAKEGKKILWHVVELHRAWQENGGIPKFLWNY